LRQEFLFIKALDRRLFFSILLQFNNQEKFVRLKQMDNYLRSERFDVEPKSSLSDKQWSHWKQTFSDFLGHIKNALEESKLQLLTNCVASNVYQYISESKLFKKAVDILVIVCKT
jgi:hypothetical protein